MSALVKDNVQFLRQIHASRRSNKKMAKLVLNASDEQLLCLVEICLNILRGRAPLQKRHLPKMQKQAHLLRHLGRVRTAKSARRLLTPQTGKGVPAIAGILASVMVPLLTEVLLKNK